MGGKVIIKAIDEKLNFFNSKCDCWVMRLVIIGHILLLVASINSKDAYALDTKKEEETCSEIGFKIKTEAHAECVVELLGRKNRKLKNQVQNSNNKAQEISDISSQSKDQTKGDGTPEHYSCARFGFVLGTSAYAECRMKMDIAKREAQQKQAAYELEMKRYQEQVAQYEKEKERRKGEAMMRFGLSLMGGTSPYFSENLANASRAAAGLPPVPPAAPDIQNFTITNPYGQNTHCTVFGSMINCH